MKKSIFILALSLIAFIACQTDNVNNDIESLESDSIELKRDGISSLQAGEFIPIPKEFVDNPEAYMDTLADDFAKNSDTSSDDDDDRYGCVTISGGVAIIDEDCTIQSGIPEDFKDCDRKGVRYLACGVNINNPLCVICAVLYIVECDGRLGTVLGYNIVCAFGEPQPL